MDEYRIIRRINGWIVDRMGYVPFKEQCHVKSNHFHREVMFDIR
jgi:hypothetical protein